LVKAAESLILVMMCEREYVLLCGADTSDTAWEQQEVSSNQLQQTEAPDGRV